MNTYKLVNGFDDINIKMPFIKKVYTILTCQLFLTFGMVAIFVLSESVKSYVQQNIALLWTAIIMSFVLLFAMICCVSAVRQYPYNYILLTGFTLCEGYFYDTDIVFYAGIMTLGVTIALTIFACQTKYDFTIFSGSLVCLLVILMLFGFMNIIMCSGSSSSTCDILDTVYAALGALVFSFAIVYDTQMIVKGNHKYQFGNDDHVFAAITLYLDIINLFIYLLKLLDKCKKK